MKTLLILLVILIAITIVGIALYFKAKADKNVSAEELEHIKKRNLRLVLIFDALYLVAIVISQLVD